MKLTARIKPVPKLTATFKELKLPLNGGFEEGYEQGYAAGYEAGEAEGVEKGYADGYREGYDEGLATRTYETWTITLVDGSVVEKEVALL